MAAKKLSLKLMIDKKSNRVVFAEAGKDVVDILFSLLSLPVGSAVKLLTKAKMTGSFGNLYESVENLEDTYINNKDLLLSPKVATISPLNVPILIPNDKATITLYSWYNRRCTPRIFTNTPNVTVLCPICKLYSLTFTTTYTLLSRAQGYVKEAVLYMVKDNLTVILVSSTAAFNVLAEFDIENVKSLEERVVDLGMDEGLELLRMSWQSENVLSQVFLVKKEK